MAFSFGTHVYDKINFTVNGYNFRENNSCFDTFKEISMEKNDKLTGSKNEIITLDFTFLKTGIS